ncbi:hypothetical protein PIB30_034771 [Stylosanthes scabra]|uniref:Transmembrane protein n=1 Tax=Stylosanthes scabra TaxID=79078 RepID=A0ABU6QCA8_9FABA|nr:hypothetical protein [Stylosanthes scabra]
MENGKDNDSGKPRGNFIIDGGGNDDSFQFVYFLRLLNCSYLFNLFLFSLSIALHYAQERLSFGFHLGGRLVQYSGNI